MVPFQEHLQLMACRPFVIYMCLPKGASFVPGLFMLQHVDLQGLGFRVTVSHPSHYYRKTLCVKDALQTSIGTQSKKHPLSLSDRAVRRGLRK